MGLWGWSRRRNSIGERGTTTKFHGNVVCNRKFNRREPRNSAGGERKRCARESEKTSRRRERERGEIARQNSL